MAQVNVDIDLLQKEFELAEKTGDLASLKSFLDSLAQKRKSIIDSSNRTLDDHNGKYNYVCDDLTKVDTGFRTHIQNARRNSIELLNEVEMVAKEKIVEMSKKNAK